MLGATSIESASARRGGRDCISAVRGDGGDGGGGTLHRTQECERRIKTPHAYNIENDDADARAVDVHRLLADWLLQRCNAQKGGAPAFERLEPTI